MKKVSLALLAWCLASSVYAFEIPSVPASVMDIAAIDPVVDDAQIQLERARKFMVAREPWSDRKPEQFDSLDVTVMPLSQLVGMYFKDFSGDSYVICSDVLRDNKPVSVRAGGALLDSAVLDAVLSQNGYRLDVINGVSYVCSEPAEVTLEQLQGKKGQIFTYWPKHRTVVELVKMASPVLYGVFANRGGSAMLDSGASVAGSDDDVLVFSGEPDQVERLEKLLEKLDVPVTSVLVRAALYEVTTREQQSSALKIFAELINGRVGLSIGSNFGVFPNSLSVSASGFEAVASLVSEDARFKVLTSPFLRVRNGRSARFQVGQDVPVASSIVINPSGQTTQGFEYVSSGVIFSVTASIRGGSIDLDLTQTVSSFTRTVVGDSTNPTLNKRELSTSLTMADGEIVVLGGLHDHQRDESAQGFFGWNPFKSRSLTDSELLLIVHAQRI